MDWMSIGISTQTGPGLPEAAIEMAFSNSKIAMAGSKTRAAYFVTLRTISMLS